MREILVLGAGTGGTMIANRLVRCLDEKKYRITVLDRDDEHLYQPGLLFVPFGSYRPEDIVRSRRATLASNVRLILGEVERLDATSQTVVTAAGTQLRYDLLVIATGCRVVPEQTPGLTESGWYESAFDFYTLAGARALARKLESFRSGTLVVDIAEMPIKCPVGPLEFLFLADAYFSDRGVRDDVELVLATPLDGAFTKPRASALLGGLLEQKKIRVVPEFTLESVEGARGALKAYDGRSLSYDLLVSIPLHAGARLIADSGLGDDMAFVPTHKHTLQSLHYPNIFVIGDATNLPSSKAGSVAHFQSEVLADNIARYLADRPLLEGFDGHANCFIETGHDKAMLIDFNYDTEPLPGRFPLPGLGPFTLLEESHANHWGKQAFRWLYWRQLLPGHDLPLDHRMSMAGKWSGEHAR